ncbi:hypothetical protein RAS2_26730 [Phycisphaerae bacterium RAS2]|nr:hypothetical protein RAS2_26730 [Phycisphaerae bacterium RAS2]
MAVSRKSASQDASNDRQLLSPDFMARLEQLEIVSRRIHASRMKGERRSKRKGESAEFADYRNYVIGDDIRHIDWNIYARLDRLFLKLFLEEEELSVSVLLDLSGSMETGEPAKSRYAKRVAAALAYIGLCNYNRVNLYLYNESVFGRLAGLRGRRMVGQMVRFLEDAPVGGKSHMAAAAKQFALRHTTKGVCLLISDFLDKGGFQEALRYLVGRQLDIYALQVLSPQEVEPDLAGDLKLVDCEDDDMAEITVSRPLLDRYKSNLQSYCEAIRSYCSQRGAVYYLARSDSSFESLVLTYLRHRGLVK